MKKLGLIFLVLIMCAGMVAGCKPEEKAEAVDLGGREVKYFSQTDGIDPRAYEAAKDTPTYEKDVARIEQLEKDFNCKIKVVTYNDFDATHKNFLTAMAAGSPPADVINNDSALGYPTYMVNMYLEPLNDYFDVYDSNDGVWDARFSKGGEWNGKVYMVTPKREMHPTNIMLFNKRIFSESSELKEYDLYQLVKDKQWTWDKMREIAMKATKDLDNDGKTDQMGVAGQGLTGSIFNNALVVSNGCHYITDVDGKKTFDINEQGMKALEFTFKLAWTDRCYGVEMPYDDWLGAMDNWQRGNVALFVTETYKAYDYKKIMTADKFGALPIPIGPDMTEYVTERSKNEIVGIIAGCQDPEKVAKLTEAIFKRPEWAISLADAIEKNFFDEESVNIIVELAQNPTFTFYQGYEKLLGLFIWGTNGLYDKVPPATYYAENYQIVQDDIDRMWMLNA